MQTSEYRHCDKCEKKALAKPTRGHLKRAAAHLGEQVGAMRKAKSEQADKLLAERREITAALRRNRRTPRPRG